MGRRTRTTLPTTSKLLRPRLPKNVKSKLQKKCEKQKYFYNRQARPLKQINVGDTVRFKNDQFWQKAMVVAKSPQPRSYVIQSGQQTFRRNRKHLIQTPEPPLSPRQEDTQDTTPTQHTEQEETNTQTNNTQTTDTDTSQVQMSARGRRIKTRREQDFLYS